MYPQPQGVITYPGIDVVHYFSNIVSYFSGHAPAYYSGLRTLIGILVGISIPISVFLVVAIIITVESLKSIRRQEEHKFSGHVEPAFTDAKVEPKVDPELGKRWKQIMEQVDGPNQNDWKQAIIDADAMLEQLVTSLGYQGQTLGEQLKRTAKGDFKTRDAAWDAHMVRNRIAHDGSLFDINQVEAKRVISLYRQVFDEFYHISG